VICLPRECRYRKHLQRISENAAAEALYNCTALKLSLTKELSALYVNLKSAPMLLGINTNTRTKLQNTRYLGTRKVTTISARSDEGYAIAQLEVARMLHHWPAAEEPHSSHQ